jgi:cobalamin biosynthesis Mg chelatase CobN
MSIETKGNVQVGNIQGSSTMGNTNEASSSAPPGSQQSIDLDSVFDAEFGKAGFSSESSNSSVLIYVIVGLVVVGLIAGGLYFSGKLDDILGKTPNPTD